MTKGAGHKSGHAANVAEAHRKAELAREHEEATKSKQGSANRVLDVKETKLLDELRKSLTPMMVRLVDGGAVATAIPNRKHMLKKTTIRRDDTTATTTGGAREREENDDDDDDDDENTTARKKTKTTKTKKRRRRETKGVEDHREEVFTTRRRQKKETSVKTYVNKAERKRLKKQRAKQRRETVL
tara:strand:+ start:6460 stop:7014 length:555 start_codon:yes stop_codon:yes gene_type:complete